MCLTNKTTLIFVDENYPKNCGAKLSVLKCCCQIVRILLCCYQIVCFFLSWCQIVCLPSWCQIVRFYYLGAKLYRAKLSYHPNFYLEYLEVKKIRGKVTKPLMTEPPSLLKKSNHNFFYQYSLLIGRVSGLCQEWYFRKPAMDKI